MDGFSYRRGELHCEDVSATELARRFGTPLYVYSRQALLNRLKEIQDAFRAADPLICYSVKALGNLSILKLLAEAGSGFDIVSGGELFRALRAGVDPQKVVYAGVGKTASEIADALRAGILMFNVESLEELSAINAEARRQKVKARMALRLNPNVNARTHAKTTTGRKENKFGIDLQTAREIFAATRRWPGLSISGLHVHLGSPIYSVDPYVKGLRKVSRFLKAVRKEGAEISTLNIGGGYAISYDGREVIRPRDYAAAILPLVEEMGLKLLLEPGRFIAGNSAILLSNVTYVKTGWAGRKFAILDAGMNDLVRPAMYGSHHHIWPVRGPASPLAGGKKAAGAGMDVVGPICETSDCFARDRKLPKLREGETVALFSAGAYGMAMSSNYNSRPRAGEVLVSGKTAKIIRERETYEDLVRGE